MAEYIEREAAIGAVKKERDYTGKFTFEEEHAWAVGFQQGITFALSDIAAIPAADVRPVVRGRWIYNDSEQFEDVFVDTMRCSCCGECVDKEIHIFQYCIELEYRYCPNCGAVMEADNEKA